MVYEKHRKFRFGNGQEQRAASYVELPQVLAGSDVKLGVHTLDAPGVPFLISVGTLKKLRAVIDVDRGFVCFKSSGRGSLDPFASRPQWSSSVGLDRRLVSWQDV